MIFLQDQQLSEHLSNHPAQQLLGLHFHNQVFFGYLFLANGIIFGIASNSFAKISDGFSKLTPSILCILFMCITMFSIAKAMSALPVGFAYSTYSGLTVTGVVLFAVLKFNQIPNIYGTIYSCTMVKR